MPDLGIRDWFRRAARHGGYLRRLAGALVVPREFLWLYAAAVLLLTAAAGTAGVSLLYRQPAVAPPAAPQEQAGAPPVPAAAPYGREEAAPPAAASAAAPVPAPEKPLPPVTGQVQRAFGWQYYPRYDDWRFHPGVDVAVPAGTSVQAALSGTVNAVDTAAGTGVTGGVASGPGQIIYGALARADVRVGDAVQRGQTLGSAGTCPAEPGYHLYFAVAGASGYLDPIKFIPQLAQ